MKAIVFAQTGGPEVLAQADIPRPDVRPGGVLIKNHAIGVNFADTRFRQGTYTVKPRLPDSPGMEAAGVIEAVGEGVTNLQPGMRVAAFTSRAYAEYCVSPAFMGVSDPGADRVSPASHSRLDWAGPERPRPLGRGRRRARRRSARQGGRRSRVRDGVE